LRQRTTLTKQGLQQLVDSRGIAAGDQFGESALNETAQNRLIVFGIPLKCQSLLPQGGCDFQHCCPFRPQTNRQLVPKQGSQSRTAAAGRNGNGKIAAAQQGRQSKISGIWSIDDADQDSSLPCFLDNSGIDQSVIRGGKSDEGSLQVTGLIGPDNDLDSF